MKIAVFGGAFNPIHKGHILLANEAVNALSIDRLLLVPTKLSPHKSNDCLADERCRLEMCVLASNQITRCEVSTLELDRQQVSYSVDTLHEICRNNSDSELYLICGSDMFMVLTEWKQPEEIFRLATLVAAPRAGIAAELMQQQKQKLQKLGARIELLDCDIPAYSSTEIREKIKSGKDVSDMLCGEVEKYILKNKLYRD